MRRRCGCSSAPRSSTCRRHHQPLPHLPHHFTTFTLPSPGAPPQAHGGRHVEVARDLSHIGNVLCDLGKLDAVRRTERPQRPPSSAAAAASGCSAATSRQSYPLGTTGSPGSTLAPSEQAAAAFREAHVLDAALLGADHVHTASDLAAIGQARRPSHLRHPLLSALLQLPHLL